MLLGLFLASGLVNLGGHSYAASFCGVELVAFVEEPTPGDPPPLPTGNDLDRSDWDAYLLELENFRVGPLETFNVRWKAASDRLTDADFRMRSNLADKLCTDIEYRQAASEVNAMLSDLRSVHFQPYVSGRDRFKNNRDFACNKRNEFFPRRKCS
jgi:hypothetical protein